MGNVGKGMELLLPSVSADILGVKSRFRYAAQTLASQLEDVDREGFYAVTFSRRASYSAFIDFSG